MNNEKRLRDALEKLSEAINNLVFECWDSPEELPDYFNSAWLDADKALEETKTEVGGGE